MVNCINLETNLHELKSLSLAFERSQKSLSDYLNSKKISFPRFYFISDDDLLSILGQADPVAIQPHLMKLFDNCKMLIFERSKTIKGMVSDEGEHYDFNNPVKPEGQVEVWMNKIDAEMKNTLKQLTKEGIFQNVKMERIKWIEKY